MTFMMVPAMKGKDVQEIQASYILPLGFAIITDYPNTRKHFVEGNFVLKLMNNKTGTLFRGRIRMDGPSE